MLFTLSTRSFSSKYDLWQWQYTRFCSFSVLCTCLVFPIKGCRYAQNNSEERVLLHGWLVSIIPAFFWDHVHTLQKAFLPVNTRTIITQNQDPGPLNTTKICPHKVCVFVPPPQNYFDHVYHTTYWQNCTVKSNLVDHILYSFSCFCRAVLTNFSVGLQMVPYAFHTYVLKCSL